jgi:hypothetical protein
VTPRTFTVTILAALARLLPGALVPCFAGLLAVLTLASSSAWAECAWVLWDPAGGRWEPVMAFKTQRECQAKAPAGTRCLPDTVDPRGPKASGR